MNHPTLFTSYTAITKKIPDSFNKLAIMRWPRYWTHGVYKDLSPSARILKGIKSGSLSRAEFDAGFEAELAELDVDQVLADIGSPTILFCVEKDPADCHRSAVAKWIERERGILVPEYQVRDDPTLF